MKSQNRFTFILGSLALTLSSALSLTSLHAQTFQKTYGTSGFSGTSGIGRAVAETSGGGYIIAADNGDNLFLKTDQNGNIQWSSAFSYGQYGGDNALAVAEAPGSGYLMLGYSMTPSYNYAMTLLKTDNAGTLQWAKAIDSLATMPTGLFTKGAMAVNSDGTIIIGYYRSAGGQTTAVVKFDASGTVQWANEYNTGWSHIVGITPDNGGFLLYGETYGSAMSWDGLLFKIDGSGNILWSYSCPMDGTGKLETIYSVKPTSDGGYIGSAVAYISGMAGGLFPAAIKLDQSMNTQWCRIFKPDVSEFPAGGGWGYDVEALSSGYMLLAWFDNAGSGKGCFISLDDNGNFQWSKEYGTLWAGNGVTQFLTLNDVMVTSDNHFLAVGGYDETSYSYKVHMVKADMNGNSGLSCAEKNPVLDSLSHPFVLQSLGLNPSALSGVTVKSSVFSSVSVSIISGNVCPAGIEVDNREDAGICIYPNPASASDPLSVKGLSPAAQLLLYNPMGQLVYSISYGAPQQLHLPAGLYVFRVKENDMISVPQKLIIQ